MTEAPRKLVAPPGGWVARQLKLINDESRGKVIPTTAASQRSYKKYSSMYDVQYSSMNEKLLGQFLKDKEIDAAERVKMEEARETVGDVFGVKRAVKPDSLKMFSNWKVPNRFMEDDNMQMSTETEKPETSRLPRIEVRRSQSVSGRRGNLPTARVTSVSPRRPIPGGRNRDMGVTGALQPRVVNQATDWMNRAPMADRKVIQDVLRMAENKHQDSHVVKQGLQPDVQNAVTKWMNGATEKDRAVAVQFFTSMTGRKLVGGTSAEQSARLQDIIKVLQREDSGVSRSSMPCANKSGGQAELHPSLKHLRLLSPASRKNRWMETTWHHLPEHRYVDPVNNWTSIYTRPHGLVPRHFTIHPEWG